MKRNEIVTIATVVGLIVAGAAMAGVIPQEGACPTIFSDYRFFGDLGRFFASWF